MEQELVDSTKSNSVTLNVDIFADGIVGSYYILWDDVDLSEDIKKQMTTRDFARDEFFMQNIELIPMAKRTISIFISFTIVLIAVSV